MVFFPSSSRANCRLAVLLVSILLFLIGCGSSTPIALAPASPTSLLTPEPVTRLIAMGDTGEGNPTQYQVSEAAQLRCDQLGGCDGFLMLGDNIYDVGPDSADDPQFEDKIDRPYANLRQGPPPAPGQPDTRPRLPIYVTLGNHDLGGAGLNVRKIPYFLDYAQTHEWFYFPEEYYEVEIGLVHLVSLQTNSMAYLGTRLRPQAQLVQQVVDSHTTPWIVVIGHHPYRSDGVHGNAGQYEGIPGDLRVFGGKFREWVEETLCDQVDFYLSGHDHNRQWLASVPEIPTRPVISLKPRRACLTRFAVSGAGAKTRDLVDRDNDLAFGSNQPGVLIMSFYTDRMEAEFCDDQGRPDWSQTFTHAQSLS